METDEAMEDSRLAEPRARTAPKRARPAPRGMTLVGDRSSARQAV